MCICLSCAEKKGAGFDTIEFGAIASYVVGRMQALG